MEFEDINVNFNSTEPEHEKRYFDTTITLVTNPIITCNYVRMINARRRLLSSDFKYNWNGNKCIKLTFRAGYFDQSHLFAHSTENISLMKITLTFDNLWDKWDMRMYDLLSQNRHYFATKIYPTKFSILRKIFMQVANRRRSERK